MIKTVKEMTEELHYFLAKTQYCDCLHEHKECKIYDRILKIQDKHENELAEKDKIIAEKDRKIDLLLTANKQITYSSKSREYNQQQLFKEDFIVHQYCINCRDDYFPFDNRCWICGWERIINLIDNSKYDKLPSKEEK